jgi:hypothetical protein
MKKMKILIRFIVLALFTGVSLFLTNNKVFGQVNSKEFKPFNVASSRFTVNDYIKWRTIYDEDKIIRENIGMSTIAVGRSIYNPSNLNTAFVFTDIEKIKTYVGSNEFQERAKKAGVTNNQSFDFFQVIRFIPGHSDIGYLYYIIKVEDFDQWLKNFDAEGTAKRLEYGLIDEVVAQDIDNNNIVHLVFLISDINKAKKMMMSSKIKKWMRKQGVTLMSNFEFYKHMEK